MSKKTDDGGPAFPVTETDPRCGTRIHPGMTLRDWFAGHPGMTLRDWFAGQALSGFDCGDYTVEHLATYAYEIADAMLVERKLPDAEQVVTEMLQTEVERLKAEIFRLQAIGRANRTPAPGGHIFVNGLCSCGQRTTDDPVKCPNLLDTKEKEE